MPPGGPTRVVVSVARRAIRLTTNREIKISAKRLFAAASLLAIAGFLALTSSASAATAVTGGPIKVRGYNMTLVGSDNGAKDSLTVIFARGAGRSSQFHSYTFQKGIKVTKTSIRGSLGRFGRVNLTLRNPRKLRNTKSVLPKGCSGRVSRSRTGTLSGKFRLVADRTYFRTVTAKKMRGASSTTGKLNCSGSGPGAKGDGNGGGGMGQGETMLSHSSLNGGATSSLVATKRSLVATHIEDPAKTKPAMVVHMISATAPGTLTVVGGGASATVKATAPFFRGRGLFTGELAGGPIVPGKLGGNLSARFDSIKPITFGGDAMLMYP